MSVALCNIFSKGTFVYCALIHAMLSMFTSALASQGVVIAACRAGGLDPVPVVLLVLNHPTDVDLLKGALVQQSQSSS